MTRAGEDEELTISRCNEVDAGNESQHVARRMPASERLVELGSANMVLLNVYWGG